MITTNDIILEDFNPENQLEWKIINDGVMGGISEGHIRINANQTADFRGNISLENNGGFTSLRALLRESVSGKFKKIKLRIKGDGKTYSFRIRTDSNFDGVAFAANFVTKNGEWTEHQFSPADFSPTFRGKTPVNVPPLKDLQIKQIGILISNKQAGNFKVVIDWIIIHI